MAEEQLDSILGRIGSQPLERQPGLLREEQAKLIPKISEAQYGENGTKRAELETEIATKEAGLQKGQEISGLAEADILEKQTEIKKHGIPTFKPTQEDLGSYAQLGSMVATLGLMLGNGGKESSRMAIGSMTGMLNGWRQGRKDLYEKESKAFDYEVKRIDSIRKDLQNDLNMAQKLWATKRTEAMTIAELAARKAGTNSILSAYIRRGDLNGAQQMLASAQKTAEEAIKEKEKAEIAKQTRNYRDLQLRLSAERNKIAASKAAAGKGGAGLLKPGAEVTKNYLGQNALVSDMQDISNDLKNPKIRKLIKDNRLESFASEELGKIVAQIANDELPSELRKFLVKIRNVRNNYYLSISGKAVTGGEALRNYGVVPQPGDTAEFMSDKVDSMIGQINRTILQNQKLYGLPPLDTATLNTFRSEKPDSTFDIRSLNINDQDSPNIESSVRSAFGEYDPTKYDYRSNPNTGQMERKLKAQR